MTGRYVVTAGYDHIESIRAQQIYMKMLLIKHAFSFVFFNGITI